MTEWMERAACIGIDPELWFPNDANSPEAQEAKQICARCNVRGQCVQFAAQTNTKDGIWGGVMFAPRKRH